MLLHCIRINQNYEKTTTQVSSGSENGDGASLQESPPPAFRSTTRKTRTFSRAKTNALITSVEYVYIFCMKPIAQAENSANC